MPKDISERIIDTPYSSPTGRGGTVSIGGGGGGGGGATNLDALTDVTLSAPANGQTLTFNSGTGQWINAAPAAMTAHALSGSYHTGLLNWPLLDFSGSDMADLTTRRHLDLQGITPNDHHNQAHVLATGTALGADHTMSGAAVGEVLRALSATTAAFDVLQHTDLGNVLPDQHHDRVHNIVTGDTSGVVHTITGVQFQVVGATALNTLGLLTPSSAPGAAAALLRTDANGGIQLDTNLLYVDGANNRVGINRTPGGATLDIIAFANADHTQRIKQKSGQTGRMWRIEDTGGSELIVLDSVGNLQSGTPGFVSGLTGWQITPQGNAEFNNIWARGELHATVFVKDEVHATGGTLLVATAGVLHDDANISSSVIDDDVLVVYSTPAGMGVPLQVVTTSGTFAGNELHVSFIGNTININDPPSGPGFYFQPGDVVRSKTEIDTGVTDFWLEVNNAVQNSGYSTYSVVKRSGTDGVLPKGSAVVSYGKQGDGRILMTSDLNYAPYIDVFTVGPNVWTGDAGSVIPRVRLGRLDGIGLPGISGVPQYGMIAGKDLSDANSGYLIASNLQFSLYKVDIRLNNGSSDTGLWTADGNIRIGSNIAADATTGFRVYTTSGAGYNPGDVVIGNTATGNFLRWNQLSGTLQVVGSLVVSDPGTTVSKTYVDNQDSSYDALAVGYGTSAQTGAQAYADARRIVGVTGSWDSPSSTTIRWGTKAVGGTPAGVAMSAAFGNATNRSIADHAGATVSVTSRTYLFVSVAGSGTMTMTATTSLATVMASVNNVLIAVADPGDSATKACSITVVAGSTYISGSNIFTGSIVAANIAATTITAAKMVLNTLTLNQMASDVTNAIDGAQTGAIAYSDKYKLQAIRGSMLVTGRNSISWGAPTDITLIYADGANIVIADGSFAGLSTTLRTYIYFNYGDTTFTAGTLLTNLTAISSLIAVFDPGATSTDPGSLSIVGGATYISGNNIVTGSIVATNIKSREISADRMDVDRLDGMRLGTIYTGILELDNGSNIHSGGKTAYANATAGFFLGYDTGTYKFDVGNASNYLRWNGTDLLLATNKALELSVTGGEVPFLRVKNTGISGTPTILLNASKPASETQMGLQADGFNALVWIASQRLSLYGDPSATPSNPFADPIVIRFGQLHPRDLYYEDDTVGLLAYKGPFSAYSLRMVGPTTPTNPAAAADIPGTFRWDDTYFYVRTSTGWKRALLTAF